MPRQLSFTNALLIVTAMFVCGMTVFPAEPDEPRSYGAAADNSGLVSAPVMYQDTMLIASTDEGVAAVVFGERREHGIKYRFRYLPNTQSIEITGEGAVSENYTNGRYDGGKLTISAGPVRFGWSAGDNHRGWVYYEPEKLRLQLASADRFDDQSHHGTPHRRVPFEKLNLSRFQIAAR